MPATPSGTAHRPLPRPRPVCIALHGFLSTSLSACARVHDADVRGGVEVWGKLDSRTDCERCTGTASSSLERCT